MSGLVSAAALPLPVNTNAALGAPARAPGVVARRPGPTRLPLPRVLLCDLDGTLIDSMPTLAEIAAEVMEEIVRDAGHAGARALPGDLRAAVRRPARRDLPRRFAQPAGVRIRSRAASPPAVAPSRCRSRRAGRSRAFVASGCGLSVSSNNGYENVETFARASVFGFDLMLGFGGETGQRASPHFDATSRIFERRSPGDAVHRRLAARRRDCRARRGPLRGAWRRPSPRSASCSASRTRP